MKKQNYKNHLRFYPPHHFVLLPTLLILFIMSLIGLFQYPQKRFEMAALSVIFLLLGYISIMLRQHYALSNQNRIVRLEMRLRYYQLTQKKLESFEDQLSFSQLAALRFASDEELPELLKQTLAENLSPKQIKQRIKNWIPDHMRV